MKKLFIAALLAVTFMTSAFAAETKVSKLVASNFKVEFKGASDVTWSSVDNYYKATFVLNNEKMEVFYNQAAEMIGTSKAITLDKLTPGAKRTFAKRFGGYNVTEAIRFEGADESAYYLCAQNEKETVIVKVDDTDQVTIVKQTRK